ncbi:hypothetical protein FHU39_004764 [Flexivirga oryzae]|uniref:Uncharacterized protein n=1 Tax=Flexivirga oryzae TaxID=1794944 RepID=A0A839NEG2_9MICO|nr:hypothetical protein [Flexivirga oryzae]
MTGKRVFVTRAQKAAARAMVDRSAVTGRPISDAVRKIAEARIEPVEPVASAGGRRTSA